MDKISTLGLAVIVDVEPCRVLSIDANVFNVITHRSIGEEMIVVWYLLSRANRSWGYAFPNTISGNIIELEVREGKTPKIGDLLVYKFRRRASLLKCFRDGKYDDWIKRTLSKYNKSGSR